MKATAPESEEMPAPQNTNLSRRVDRSLIISLVAVAISLIGTLVSIYEARVLRDQQNLLVEQKSASAWPLVAVQSDISVSGDTMATLVFSIENLGIGPAILGDVRYRYRNKDYETYSIVKAMRKDISELERPDMEGFQISSVQNYQIDSLVLPPERETKIFTAKIIGGNNYASLRLANELANQVAINFCYCSVYGDCWFRGPGRVPSKNPDCESYVSY